MSCVLLLVAFVLLLVTWIPMFVALRQANNTNRLMLRELIHVRVALARERWTAANACRQPQSGPPPCETIPAGHCNESTHRHEPPRT